MKCEVAMLPFYFIVSDMFHLLYTIHNKEKYEKRIPNTMAIMSEHAHDYQFVQWP